MAKSNDPKVRVARPYAGVKRVQRAPAHPFSLKTRPFQIQPFLISPVLPGETLTNLVHQSRTVTKPIKDPLLGWWTEHYYFYVRLRDIEYHLGDNFLDATEWTRRHGKTSDQPPHEAERDRSRPDQ